MVIGMDRAQNHQASMWAESTAGLVERAVGMLLPDKRWRTFRITLSDRAPAEGEPWAEASVGHDGHRWVYRLLIRAAADAPPGRVNPVLVRLLLSGYVMDSRVSLPDGDVGNPPLVPEWFSNGLMDAMDSGLREQSAQAGYTAWESGRLPLPGDFLREKMRGAAGGPGAAAADGYDPEAMRAAGALLVRWLQMQPDRKETFRRFFDAVAAEKPLDVNTMAAVLGKQSAGELLDDWDRWMMMQLRIVHKPGAVTALALRRLKAQLLLYPPDSGTGFVGSFDRPLEPAQLLDRRGEPWLPDAAERRCSALMMAALGRGDECGKVASLYCGFFRGLVSNASDRQLRKMLKEADDALSALEKKAGGESAGGATWLEEKR